MIKVSASIVTFNSEKEISNVLNCLYICNNEYPIEVFVVDNNSADKTVEIIEKEFSWVHLIKCNKNYGFGCAHNIAINVVDSDIHLIVNPDILIDKDNYKKMIDYLSNDMTISIVSPKVVNPDGTTQYLPKRVPRFKYLFGSVVPLFKKYRDYYTMKDYRENDPIEVDFCTGCFMICRTSFLKQCGGFDERYFLYFEDADLTREMKKYGLAIYNPGFFVTHVWQRENRKSLKGIKRFLSSFSKYRKKWNKQKTS